MSQFRIQALLLCMVVALGEASVLRIGAAEVAFCGTTSTDDTCLGDAQSKAIRSLSFTRWSPNPNPLSFAVRVPTTVWEPDLKEARLHLLQKPIEVLAWSNQEERVQSYGLSYGSAWVSELTCNLVQIEIARYGGNARREIVGTYEATVSQACYFKVENSVHGRGFWFPPGAFTANMTQNRTFPASDGYQIVGVQMEFGAGNLTGIPASIVEIPVPVPESTTSATPVLV